MCRACGFGHVTIALERQWSDETAPLAELRGEVGAEALVMIAALPVVTTKSEHKRDRQRAPMPSSARAITRCYRVWPCLRRSCSDAFGEGRGRLAPGS
jgi:hypothetical protein